MKKEETSMEIHSFFLILTSRSIKKTPSANEPIIAYIGTRILTAVNRQENIIAQQNVLRTSVSTIVIFLILLIILRLLISLSKLYSLFNNLSTKAERKRLVQIREIRGNIFGQSAWQSPANSVFQFPVFH